MRRNKCSKISLLSIIRKYFCKIILFKKKGRDVLLKTNWRLTIYVFYIVSYPNSGNKILKKITWNILDRNYTKD